jgi:hypothetical protein
MLTMNCGALRKLLPLVRKQLTGVDGGFRLNVQEVSRLGRIAPGLAFLS